MNFEELLLKYTDNTINESELIALNEIINKSASHSDEFKRFTKLENDLNSTKTFISPADVEFLKNVGESLVTADEKFIPSNKSTDYKVLNLSKYKYFFIFGFLLISLTIGYFINDNLKYNTQPSKPINRIDLHQQEEIRKTVTESQGSNSTDKNIQEQNVQINDANSSNSHEILMADNSTNKSQEKVQLSIKENNLVKNSDIINKLQNDLKNYQSTGDLYGQALTQKRIGVLLRQINGRTQEAFEYLNNALNLSLKLKNIEMQAEIIGEIGLTYSKSGDKSKGSEYLDKCVKLLESINSDSYGHWKELKSKFN